MVKRIIRILAVIMTIFGIACAGSEPRRDDERAVVFDERQFLTAEAAGGTQGEASRAAMAALAAIFHSRVRSETQSTANSYVLPGQGEQFEKQVGQMVRIETDVQLQGALIGWVRPDEAAGGYRALAVLNREQAAGRWRRELERIQTAIDSGLAALPSVQGRLPRLIALNRLIELVGEMALTESRLSVLGRPAMPYDTDLGAVFSERERLVQTASFCIQVEGEAAQGFDHRLGAWITRQGYQISGSADGAAGLISGTVWFQPLALDNPNVTFIRALADIAIIDLDTREEIAAFSENIRKGHMDENEARRRALDSLADRTGVKIVEALGAFGMSPEASGDE